MCLATDAVTDLVAEYLIMGAILGPRANTLAVSIAVLERRLTHSIVVTLTSAALLIENSWWKTEHFSGTFAFTRVCIKYLTS